MPPDPGNRRGICSGGVGARDATGRERKICAQSGDSIDVRRGNGAGIVSLRSNSDFAERLTELERSTSPVTPIDERDEIDLRRKVYRIFVGKGAKWREKPIDDEVFDALANLEGRKGRIFPWRTRSGVYKWLRPLTRRLGVNFTPHMARHYGGKQLNRAGAGLKTIMGPLDHSDASSSLRYQDADVDIVREALSRAKRNGTGSPE